MRQRKSRTEILARLGSIPITFVSQRHSETIAACATTTAWGAESMRFWKRRPTCHQRQPTPAAELFSCDALNLLKGIRDDVTDIVFLDPPFNLGKRYGSRSPKKDRLSPDEYEKEMREVLQEAARILRPGGALYLYHLPEWALRLGYSTMETLSLRHWIAVSMKNGFVREGRLYPAHYALLYLTKGSPRVFNRPKIPVLRCRHCDGSVRDYGGYEKFVKDGINLSDVWDDISPVRHPANKHREANEIPMTIVERVVEISGSPGGILVDPFMGTGSSLVAAMRAGMRAVGADAEPSQVGIVEERLQRQSGKEETYGGS